MRNPIFKLKAEQARLGKIRRGIRTGYAAFLAALPCRPRSPSEEAREIRPRTATRALTLCDWNLCFLLILSQEMHVEHEVSAFKNHLQFEQLLGRAPPLSDTEMQATLRKKALDLEREEREHNCAALANFVTDSTFAIILVANLLLQLEEAEKLRKTLSKEFFSLDSSRQAFILLLVSDILVGYHSAEGWSTGLEGIGHHYGLDVRTPAPSLTVPTSHPGTTEIPRLCRRGGSAPDALRRGRNRFVQY